MSSRIHRRRFLEASAAAGYFYTATALSAARAADEPNSKVHIAGIGVGGKGSSDINQAGNVGEVVAICDIDDNQLDAKAKQFSSAKKYNDFRKMLDEMGKQIDAVTVSTPDHTHAPASIMAMKMKKHVYCQKPLTHTVYEARQMRDIAKQYGVATQMGNQGSAANGLRRAVELIQGGLIGPVEEAHVWTNRPIWPQGADAILDVQAAHDAAFAALHGKTLSQLPSTEPPKHVHWDLFLGPAPERPYSRIYHPFSWRGWLDYGTGALGDMACHTANMAFRALKLGYPTSVIAEATGVNAETYPNSAKVTFQFPEREGMPPVKFVWYEGQRGGKKLLPPDDLVKRALTLSGRLVDSGSILVGKKGILYSPDDYGARIYASTIQQGEQINMSKPEKLPATSGRNTDQTQKDEWVAAIKGGPAPYSNFDFAAMLTETILLGNIAIRMTGQKLEWDGPSLKFANNSKANDYLHYEYRKGWTL